MGLTAFVWGRFGRSLVQKGAVAFLAMLASLAVAPHVAPILQQLGIGIETQPGVTHIWIQHATFAAGLSALAFALIEGARVWLAKHPKSPVPPSVKRLL